MSKIYNNIVNNLSNREILLDKNPNLKSNRIIKSFFNQSTYFYRTDLRFHKGSVNALRFSENGQYMVSGGDDMIVAFWDVEKSLTNNYQPSKMKMRHHANIFQLELNNDASKCISGGADEQVIVHDTSNGNLITSRFLDSPVYALSMNPFQSSVCAVGCEDGQIVLLDSRSPNSSDTLNDVLGDCSLRSLQFNPIQEHLLLAAYESRLKDVFLIDLRNKSIVFEYLPPLKYYKSSMFATYNRKADRILVLRKCQPISLYSSDNSSSICEFDSYGYHNSVTLKNACFASSSDDFIVAPSDDFNVHIYKIPDNLDLKPSENSRTKFVNQESIILRGHKSIVNQVCYNYNRCILSSSGIETLVKLWSPFPLNLQSEQNKNHLSSTYNNRKISPYMLTRPLAVDMDSDDGLTNANNDEDEIFLNYFDNLIRRDLSKVDEFEEFTSTGRNLNRMEIDDLNFKQGLKYIESLISDFKENGEKNKQNLINRLKKEQKKENIKPSKMITTRSISYLFECKKLNQQKALLKSSFNLVQERIRYLRKVKHMNNNRDDEEWIANLQSFLKTEPQLKQILNDLNAMYKDKRLIESVSSPFNAQLLRLLDCLFFRRTLSNYAPSTLHDDHSSDTSTASSNDQSSSTKKNHENSNDSLQANNGDSLISIAESSPDRSLRLSDDDSLSAGSVIDSDDEKKKEKNQRHLKRKKSVLKKSDYVIHMNLFSSNDSDSSCEDHPIRKMKKSNEKFKDRDYNFFAFDSDFDCSESSTDEESEVVREDSRYTKLREKNDRIRCISLPASSSSRLSTIDESSKSDDRNQCRSSDED